MKVSSLFETLSLSAEEEALWLLHELDSSDTTYHIAGALRVFGPIDVGQLTSAWEMVARRHLALSTAVREVNGVRSRVPVASPLDIRVTDATNLQARLRELTEAPFDLGRGPLLRVLIASDEFSTVIAACAHHIAVDLHSIVVLLREVELLYEQLLVDKDAVLPPPRAQHHDYVVAQRERQEKAAAKMLPARAEILKAHPLPSGAALRSLPSGAPLARRIHRTLAPRYRRALIDQSKAISVTPYAWVLAAAQSLVGRLERVERFSAVTPTTGRRSTALLDAVGYFVNLVPVPCELEPQQSFEAAAVACSRRAKEAFAAREIPFPQLIAASGSSASAPRPALAVTYERPADKRFTALISGVPSAETTYLECAAQVVELPRPAPQADLAIAAIDDGHRLQICFDSDARVYDAAHADAVADAFVALLEASLDDRATLVRDLPLLSAAGQAAMLALGSEPATSALAHETLHGAVLAAAERWPNAVAVEHGGVAVRYRELVASAAQVAAALVARGVTPGTPVAVWMAPSSELVIAALAAMLAGGVYMPVDPALPQGRVARMFADAAPPVVVVAGDAAGAELAALAGQLEGVAVCCATVAELNAAGAGADFAPVRRGGDDVGYLIYTSGSTGRPKGVRCTHGGARNLIEAIARRAPVTAGQAASAFCNPAFDVSIYELFAALGEGSSLRFAPAEIRGDAEALVAWLLEEKIGGAFVPAMALPALLAALQGKKAALRRLLVGVEPIPQTLLRALATACPGLQVVNGYGPTEAAICATLWTDGGGALVEGRPAPIGRPVPGTGAHLVDAYGGLLPRGSIGELVLTGRGLALGYLGDAELTAKKFASIAVAGSQERAYRTGDLARWNDDGTLQFAGRIDGQVKLRGHRIERGEIETVIREQAGVIECHVDVWSDVPGGRLVVHLAVEGGRGGADDAEAVIGAARARAAQLLPSYMVPSQWVPVAALPRTANGKVDPSRLTLPKRAGEVSDAPCDPLTASVAAEFAAVLRGAVGPDEDFFSLGGHSLLASQLVARLRARHSVELPLAALWQAPTPRRLAARIAAAAPLALEAQASSPARTTWPLTGAQRRMWMHEQLTPGSRAYHMTDAIRIGGALDVERLRAALSHVVERHAPLRSVIRARDEELTAVVQFAPSVELPVVELSDVTMVDELVGQVATPAFDLAHGPLFRFALAKLADDDHVLVLCIHHIACDGWSLGVLARDVFSFYAEVALWPIAKSYGELAAQQHAQDTAERKARAVEYWQPRLRELPTVELGRDGLASRDTPVRARATIGHDVLAQLAPVARQAQATPFMALVAVVQLWLSRISGGQDVVVGAPFADRSTPESEPLVGLLLDTLVLRSQVASGASFVELLAAARDTVVSGLDHRAAPVEQILADLGAAGGRPAGVAPYDVLVNFISVPELAPQLGGLELSRLAPVVTAPKFPLTVYAVLTDSGLDLELVAQGDVFSPARLDSAARQLAWLFGELVAAPRRHVSEASLIDDVDAMVLPDPALPLALEAVGFVHDRILAQPRGAVALRFAGGELSYGELADRSAHIAARLQESGLPPGTAVGIHAARSPGAIVAMLGVLRAGYVMVMIDESLPQRRRERLCETAGVRLALAVGAAGALDLDDVRWHAVSSDGVLEGASAASAPVIPAIADPDEAAYIFFTSGTTGTPKAVLGTHRGLAHFVSWQVARFEIGSNDRAAHLTSLGFDVVLRDVLTPLSGGATLCIPTGTLDPSTLLPWLDEQRITLMHTVPTLLNWWLDHGDPRLALASLRWIFSAGEALHASLVERWQRTFPRAQTRFVNIYGPTETTMAKMFNVIERVVPGNQPVGRPLPQTQALVLRDGRVRCGVGEVGEIWIRTPYRTRGYLGDAVATQDKFVLSPWATDDHDRIYKTGDLGRYRPDGLLEVLGRVDHQVKIGGVRIEPDEIAGVLTKMRGVRRAAVIAMARPDGQKALVAYVVVDEVPDAAAPDAAAPGAPQAAWTAESLTSAITGELPAAMIPSRIVFVADLPTNANGKLDRRALPEPCWDAPAGAGALPTTETEHKLAAIWSELLGGRQIGIHDNFFSSGGHSLLAMRLVARVAAELGAEIGLRELFEEPTIAAMALLVEKAAAAPREGRAASARADYAALREAPLTELQAAYLFGRRSDVAMGGVPTHGYAEIDLPNLDRAALQRALELVTARHDALRLRFFDDRQELASSTDTVIVEHDWRDLSQVATAVRLTELRRQMVGSPLPADRAPLVRLAVSRCYTADGAELDRLHVVFDALIVDAASSRILAGELLAAYRGETLPPAPPPGRFLGYVHGLADLEASSDFEAARRYWMDRLPSLPDGPELPLAVDVATLSGASFRRTTAQIGAEAWQRFRERAAAAGVTPTSALLAAYAQVVAHYARRASFCVNVTSSRRPGAVEDAGVLGNFTSLLLVEVDGGAGKSVAEQLRTVHGQLWRDLGAASFSGVRVMREIARTGRPPAMPVVFTSALGDAREADLPEPSYGVTRSSQVVLNHGVSERDGGLLLRWDVVAEAFRPGVAEEMLELLRQTLCELADRDWASTRFDRLVGETAAAFDAEHNRTEGPRPTQTMHQAIFETARRVPESPALVGPCVPNQAMSYAELLERAGGVTSWLRGLPGRARAGADGQVDRVVLLMKKGWEQAVAVVGVLGARCAYVPVDPSQPVARIREIFEQIQPAAVLTQARFLDHGALEGLPHQAVDHMARIADVDFDNGSLEDLAYVIFTSGSTGRPKGVAIDHRGAANTVLDINERYQVTAADRTLAISSLSFDLSVYDLMGFLSIGGAVVVPDAERERDAEHLARCVATYGVTLWNSVPAFLEMVVEQTAEEPQLLASIRLAMLSGDWIPLRLVERTRLLQPQIVMMSLGGATEASVWSNDFPIGAIEADWKSVPYGRPLRNQTMHVLDPAGNPRPAWAVGELHIGGIGVALGYYGDAQRTAERFIEHPTLGRLYRTGDLGRRWRDGVLELLGRDDLQVKIRGFRIELGEIEAAMRGAPNVREAVCAVRTAPGGRGGQLFGYVIPESGALDEAAVLAHVAAKVPEYMVPSRLISLEALPLSSNGKVDRRRLPEPSAEVATAGKAPETANERALASIWCEVLRVPTVVTSDEFLALGGDSIRAVQVVSRARRLGLSLEVRALLERTSLAELAERAGAAKEAPAVLAIPDGDRAPLAPIQRWFMQQEFAAQDHWNQSVAADLTEPVDAAALEGALRNLEARHHGLRLRFEKRGESWQQYVAPVGERSVALARLDVRAMSAEGAKLAMSLHADRLHKSLSLEHGPVWGALLIEGLEAAPQRLVVVAHHLVVDGISWRVLLEDLDASLRGAELLPVTTGFAAWAARRTAYAVEQREAAEAAVEEMDSWPWRAVKALPVDDAAAKNLVAAAGRAAVRLDAATTALLVERASARRDVNLEAILVTALAKALRRWTGDDAYALYMEAHGRDAAEPLNVDISRSVGWFTRLTPMVIEVGDESMEEATEEVAAQLRARRLGALAEELWHAEDVSAAGLLAVGRREPEISFDYLGHADGVLPAGARLRWAGAAPGSTRSPLAARRDLLEVIAHVGNGQLEVNFTHGDRHRPATIAALAVGVERELKALVAPRLDVTEVDPVVVDRYPLSPLQELMLDGAAQRAGTYHVQWVMPLVGELDAEAMGQAWQRLVSRHAILRTALRDADGQTRQVEFAHVETTVTVYDGRELAEDVSALLAQDRATQFELEAPPLARLAVVLGPKQRHHLLFSHHHAILDGWSEPRLFSELFALYEAELEGRTLVLPPVPSQRAFVDWLYSQSEGSPGRDVVAPSIRRRTPAPSGAEAAGVVRGALSADVLTRAARRFRVTPGAVASTAWAVALGAGEGDVSIGLASSVRPADVPDIESVLGCFLNVAPLSCAELSELPLERALGEVQSRQLRALDRAHLPLVESCRALNVQRGAIESVLRFQSYAFSLTLPKSLRSWRGLGHIERCDFEAYDVWHFPLNLVIIPDRELTIQLDYDPARVHHNQAQRLVRRLTAALNALPEVTGSLSDLEATVAHQAGERAVLAAAGFWGGQMIGLGTELRAPEDD